ncbi:anti-sigma factor [Pararobbsia silviterrae]|uniref:Anti-sigma factor n=1 Tax=Pararobbsia silviterrae TaxID=1792498 RepID=A0A494Y7K1_9BURK|nr:anti-sigma factor [Pararobbsia silviterrae]RKP55900.1 anti-sigma factor [Pararobbsia silviterrae]
MNIDDTLLMAYVDGELPPSRKAELAQAIAHSDELAARVAALRASALPYRAAFTHAELPPVPAALADFIETLARTGDGARGERGERGANTDPNADVATHADRTHHGLGSSDLAQDERIASMPDAAITSDATASTRGTHRARRPGLWLAAAFIAGAFVCGAALKFGPMLGEPRVAPWLEAAAGYQELYTRDTVYDLPDSATLDARVLDEVHQEDHLPIAIPDLRDAGLTFKRIQRLRFRGRPLIQIVYLPVHGDPVALCVIDAKADQPMKSQHVYGMDVVSWSRDKLAFALIGRNRDVDLAAVHRQLADDPSRLRVE